MNWMRVLRPCQMPLASPGKRPASCGATMTDAFDYCVGCGTWRGQEAVNTAARTNDDTETRG